MEALLESTAPRAEPTPIEPLLVAARRSANAWRAQTLRERLALLRRFRHLAASEAQRLATLASPHHESAASALAAEVLPLLDACRFLERCAPALLKTRRIPRPGSSSWLGRIGFRIARDPLGTVLIVAPSNYPLFLPGVQLLQALAAGNAVALKPAPGGSAALSTLRHLLATAGLDPHLVALLPEDPSAVAEALEAGVDRVLFTGSSASGRAVQALCAERMVPLTAELSGCDACFVLAGADLDRVTDALRFGLLLNGGRTCIAPRRVLAHRDIADALEARMTRVVDEAAPVPLDATLQPRLGELLREARARGARVLQPRTAPDGAHGPFLILGADPHLELFRSEVFAPVLSILPFSDREHALDLDHRCPHALGASIFGPARQARALARDVDAGFVAVNDLIVPSADARVSFGGRRISGFGTTRGTEGLLELTAAKVIAVRRGRRLRHLEPSKPGDAHILDALARLRHGRGWSDRLRATRDLIRAVKSRDRT